MTNCILNVAVGSNHVRGQARLRASLVRNARATQLFWTSEWPGEPHHKQPYGFKIDAFDRAADTGRPRALWLDASVWAVKPIAQVWDWLDRHGVLLLGDGWTVGQWTSDAALDIYGVTREDALRMQLCYACVVGIDLSSEIGVTFLERWASLRDAGAFVGPWTNEGGAASADPRCLGHRHDQSAASWLAHDMGIPMAHMPDFLSTSLTESDPIFRAAGM